MSYILSSAPPLFTCRNAKASTLLETYNLVCETPSFIICEELQHYVVLCTTRAEEIVIPRVTGLLGTYCRDAKGVKSLLATPTMEHVAISPPELTVSTHVPCKGMCIAWLAFRCLGSEPGHPYRHRVGPCRSLEFSEAPRVGYQRCPEWSSGLD